MKLFHGNRFKKEIPPLPQSLWRNPLHFIAFGFGAGALPFMPGTFGTLIAIPFYLLLQPLPWITYLFFVAVITALSIFLCHCLEKELHVHDHPGMCLDEIIGYLITMIHAPRGMLWIILGFLLFRFFDIVKPPPIRAIDLHVKGGLGMMLDDILAGVFSMLILQLLSKVL